MNESIAKCNESVAKFKTQTTHATLMTDKSMKNESRENVTLFYMMRAAIIIR